MSNQRRRCEATGKACFRSPESARRARRGVRNRLRAYLCPHCRQFHVTNSEHNGKSREP